MKHTHWMALVPSALLVLAGGSTLAAGSRSRSAIPAIDKVYFAQHHVLEPGDPLFKLVGELEALIKVQVYSDAPDRSPHVFATLRLGDTMRDIRLRGPDTLPRRPDGDPALRVHSYDDSFTAMIPREWVKPGLNVVVELRDYDYVNSKDDTDYVNVNPRREITLLDTRSIPDLKIGAPTRMVMHMFDIHHFGLGKGADYPQGWQAELKARLPFAELDLRRVRDITFDEIVIPPGMGFPPARFGNAGDLEAFAGEFERKTGRLFSHQIGRLAYLWGAALKRAGSGSELYRTYCINSAGILSSGRGGNYVTSNHLHRRGLLLHELGHAYGLPHWSGHRDYPYQRTLYGRDQGVESAPNAGPTWAFDLNLREFLPAYVMIDGAIQWIHDPMHGGGRSRVTNAVYTHFSDYSIHRMQQWIESRGVSWNDEIGEYARWNQTTGAYDLVVENDGLRLPVERDVEVMSLMVTANATVPEANIIHPPIGPYVAGLVRVFDADSEADRQAAGELGYSPDTCTVALRVTQGGTVTSYLLRVGISPEDGIQAFNVTALNLPVRDGEITNVELLYCPDVMTNGITPDHKVLAVWPQPPPQ